MVLDRVKDAFQSAISAAGYASQNFVVNTPAQKDFGDYATPVALQIGKREKTNPLTVAERIKNELEDSELFEQVEVAKPGFINVKIRKQILLDNLMNIATQNEKFGSTEKKKNMEVIVEFSSPNIAKPFTIGHLRSTIIGESIAKLLEKQGAKVYRDNHVGDWGTQFGKLTYAIDKLHEGSIEDIEKLEEPIRKLVELYILFHTKADEDETLAEKGKEYFAKLEKGDKRIRALWEKCIQLSWKEFYKIYDRIGFNNTKFENDGRGYGESHFILNGYVDRALEQVEKLTYKGENLLKESKGAKLFFFPDEKYPPLMMLKDDGATLYSTRDLGTDLFRLEHYGKDITIINEVGIEQKLYFQQIFEIETKYLQWFKPVQRVHIGHGLYRFKDQKMSTRKGNVVWLEEVLDEAVKKAGELSDEPNSKVSSEAIGIGAIKWNDLKRRSHLNINFDWDEVLNLQGDSGPYIQYTYVRCRSILKKYGGEVKMQSASEELNPEENAILSSLIHYPEVVHEAAKNFAPNYICTYLYELAQEYNLFYQKHQILNCEDENAKQLRLALTVAVSIVIKNGLTLLGIETVEKM